MNSSLNASNIVINDEEKNIVSQSEAEKAVKTLIEYIGEDPYREGLIDTPKRVIKSFREFYSGYGQNPEELLYKPLKKLRGIMILFC